MNDRTPIEQLLDRVELLILRYGNYAPNAHTASSLGYIDQTRKLLPLGSAPQIWRSVVGLAHRAVVTLNETDT